MLSRPVIIVGFDTYTYTHTHTHKFTGSRVPLYQLLMIAEVRLNQIKTKQNKLGLGNTIIV